MEIKENAVVTLTYVLKLDSGEIVDTANEQSPFAFIHGIGATLPAFDKNLKGLVPSETFAFSLTAQEGYGEYDANQVVKVAKEAFEGAPPELVIEKGKTLPMQDNQGNMFWATITEVHPDGAVQMDLNHPLAGKSLHFSGTVVSVREATREELDHGHVHGPGGHHH